MAARPISRHQKLLLRLAAQLDATGRFAVRPEYELVVDDGPVATVRVPDVVVAPERRAEHVGVADLALGVTVDLVALDR